MLVSSKHSESIWCRCRISLKYTHNAYDFSILGNTPITFPMCGTTPRSGYAIRASVPNFHGFYGAGRDVQRCGAVFPAAGGGLGVTVGQSGSVFRIDHDEKFNSPLHLQYQPWKRGPWVASTGGMTAVSSPAQFQTLRPR